MIQIIVVYNRGLLLAIFYRKNFMRNILIGILIIILLIAGAFFLGPSAPTPELTTELPQIAEDLRRLEEQINRQEQSIGNIKPDNQARIVWADGYTYEKSPYSLVYLHGFSASQGEGDPIHLEFARRYGCNTYLARLASHGLDEEEAMLDLTPENLLASAKEAVAIGQQIGERVIVMSTSTGGTLALYIASEHTEFAGLICYSPNIDLFDKTSSLLVGPWGLQLARLVLGGKYNISDLSEEEQQYWTGKYRIEALVALKSLVNATMKEEVFEKVTSPLFLGYYYKDEIAQDSTVSIPRMLEMYEQLGTPDELKRKVAFPDVSGHVIASKYSSKDVESVRKATFEFAEEILKIQPVSVDTLNSE